MRIRVKICGITRPQDAVVAAYAGADAIGLVFYPASPRAVSVAQAEEIIQALPPLVTVVGLFVNAAQAEIEQVLQQVPLDVLQFHGEEEPEECERYGRPYLKAIRMAEEVDVVALARHYRHAAGILLDTFRAGVAGGTGETFDWQRVPTGLNKPLILAGGLNPDNVATAIRRVQPYAVDVSGGVEADKGIKDRHKIEAFMAEVASSGKN